jgi:hypothetical protein
MIYSLLVQLGARCSTGQSELVMRAEERAVEVQPFGTGENAGRDVSVSAVVGGVPAITSDWFAVVLTERLRDLVLIYPPAAGAAIVKFSDIQPSEPRCDDISGRARRPTSVPVEPV